MVVGAGLSGLIAARDLQARGYRVRVFEARDRVGGRVLGASIGQGQTIEMGGQFVGPTQNSLLGLVNDLGLSTYPTYTSGKHTYYRRGSTVRYDAANGPIPPIGERAAGQLLTVIEELNRMAAEVRPDRPWEAQHAAEWDGQSFQEWIDTIVDEPEARLVIEYVVRGTNTCEPRQLSLLHMISYVAAAGDDDHLGSILRVVVTADGASMFRIEAGSQQVPQMLARELDEVISLSTPVTGIRQSEEGVVVTAGAAEFRAERVIVAIPPVVAADIDFIPPLPDTRRQLTKRLLKGAQIKVNVVYDRPFWRVQGLSGYVLSDSGPAQNVWDNTPAAGYPGVLVCFVKADAAASFDTKSDQEIEEGVLANLVDYFGEAAAVPRMVVATRWHTEPWTQGCPGSLAPPGLLTAYGRAMRQPVDHVHWAGTETATYWQGFMEGAVSAGLRAAAEVAQQLEQAHRSVISTEGVTQA